MASPEQKQNSLWGKLRGPALAVLSVLALALLGAFHGGYFSQGESLPTSNTEIEGTTPSGNFSLSDTQAQGSVFLWNTQERLIHIVDFDTASLQKSILTEENPKGIVPTPGGVSVFVSFENSGRIEVYSAETYELQNSLETGLDSIEHMSFSPNGDRLFLVDAAGALTQFSHRLLELSDPRTLSNLPGQGPIVPNRRGTRLYQGGPEQITGIFASALSLLEPFSVPLLNPIFDEGYSELWGLSPDRFPRQVNERTGEILWTGDIRVRSDALVRNQNIFYLSEDGEKVLDYTPRQTNQLNLTQLPFRSELLIRAPGTGVWALSAGGDLAVVDAGKVVFHHSIGIPGAINGAVSSVVRRDGSFACF